MRILGIETSCDETAAAVFEDGRVISSIVLSQEIHREFGGVVPEVASRQHMKAIVPIVRRALEDAGAGCESLDAVAVALGPGLIGSLIVGVAFAKSLCLATRKPLVGVDHVEAHIAAVYITYGELETPLVCLVASGGHTHLFRVDPGRAIQLLGSTSDDAAGESFDKVARMLGLDYPGGPEIEREARRGDPDAIPFPRPMLQKGCDFSFSGLKTAVALEVARRRPLGPESVADIAASFEAAATDVLVARARRALVQESLSRLVVVGGVAANQRLRTHMAEAARQDGFRVVFPPLALCTDNAAMIAAAGAKLLARGERHGPGLEAFSRVPLGSRAEGA